MAAGYGTSPSFVLSGYRPDGQYFQFVELLFGGLPARARGDGLDGHSWWPLFRTTPAEYAESYYPVEVERYVPVKDSGGPGCTAAGAGSRRSISSPATGWSPIVDDRALISPWGVHGGRAGGRSTKLLIRVDGETVELPSKIDGIKVADGDRLVFRTAGAGGWGDPLKRDADLVARDVRRGLVSAEVAQEGYGVMLGPRTSPG